MDWLQNLLFDENSIAHIVLLYSFVIAVGVLLGKIKFFGVSLGVYFCFVYRYCLRTFRLNGEYTDTYIFTGFRTDIVRVLYRTSGRSFFFLFL